MTNEEKREAYAEGRYVCEVPPVCPSGWTSEDWIRWIDHTGKFIPLDPCSA